MTDPRVNAYLKAIQNLQAGQYQIQVPTEPANDELDRLGPALNQLAQDLEKRARETLCLQRITVQTNAGLLLDDVLENLYHEARCLIPYHRIGLALLEDLGRTVRARWAKSDQTGIQLQPGYSAPLAGSSLQTILSTGRPRIINDLADYLQRKPQSESTRLVLAEGIRSSLTCPLIADSQPIGFLFFSSTEPDTYANLHVDTFQRIAQQLSAIVAKGQLASELLEWKNIIERQNAELRRLNEMRNTFLGIAAHDLRNPLGNLQVTTEFLMAEQAALSAEELRSFLQDMYGQADYMLALLNDLLDVTQIESGNVKLQRENVALDHLLADTVQRQSRLAEHKGTRILLEAAPPNQINTDPLRLRQIMDNLISNAVKYAPPGSTVRVRALPQPDGWRLEVQDEGPGVTQEDRQRMFKDFARLSARPTANEKSTGLGLAITRRLVNALGGWIDVTSEPAQGATFWFTLPNT